MTRSYLLSLRVVQVHPSSSIIAWNSSLETQAAGSTVPLSQRMMQGILLISARRVKQSSAYIWKRMRSCWKRILSCMVNLAIRIIPPACTTKVGTSGTQNTRNPFSVRSLLILSSEVLLPPQGPPVMTILQIEFLAADRISKFSPMGLRQTWSRIGSASFLTLSLLSMALASKIFSSSFSLFSRRMYRAAATTTAAKATAIMFPILFILLNQNNVEICNCGGYRNGNRRADGGLKGWGWGRVAEGWQVEAERAQRGKCQALNYTWICL